MPNIPTVGIFAPNGYLNIGSFASPSGQSDPYGNLYPTGTTPGKVIELSAPEARSIAAPGTTLFDGAYQVVQLDSGATASLASNGLSAWIRLDSGAAQGGLPQTSYEVPVVTTADQANVLGGADTALFAGVFINPATYLGSVNTPVAGQYCFIFVGAGRATVTYDASATAGQQVLPIAPSSAQTGFFHPASAAASVYPFGIALNTTTTGAGGQGVAMFQNLIYRIGGQGV